MQAQLISFSMAPAKYRHRMPGLTVNPNGTYNVLEVGTNAAFETDAQNAFDMLSIKLQVAVPMSSLQLDFCMLLTTPLANLMNTKDAIVANAKAGVYGTSWQELAWTSRIIGFS